MLNKDFEKIFNLSKKTGDKFIVLPEFGDPFVIVPFREYEKILNFTPDITNLTEEELLDKINRDIAIWKDSQKDFDSDWLPDSFSAEDIHQDDLPFEENEENEAWENPLTKDPFAYEPIPPWLEDEINDENLNDEYNFKPVTAMDLNKDFYEEKKENIENLEKPTEDYLPEPIETPSEPAEEIWFQPAPRKENTNSENLKYENIPPPPDLSPSAVMPEKVEPTPVIDLSFDDNTKAGETPATEDEFAEEPVY